MRPIIEYHGPLFQLLSRVVMRIGPDNALLIWRSGAVVWLLSLAGLALTKRYSGLFTALVLLGVGLLRVPGLGLMEQNVDESQWIVSAATLVDDPYFWWSVDGTTSGPLNVWLPALMYYAGLSLDYATLRFWGLITCVLPTMWLLLVTFRYQFGERIARLAIVPAATCLALTTHADGVAFNSEQLPMLLLALTGCLLSRIFAEKSAAHRSPGWLLTLGFALGCLPYTKLQATLAGLLIAGWVLVWLFTDRPTPAILGRVSLFVAGGLLPTGLVGLYLLATGLTNYAFRSYVLTNLDYAQAGSWGAGALSWADRLTVRLPQIYAGIPTTSWFWYLALLLSLIWFVKALFRPAPGNRANGKFWFTASICLVSLYATLQPGNSFPHYQWLSFVPVSWLIAELIRLLTRESTLGSARDQPPLNQRWARGLVGGYLLVSTGYPGWLTLSRSNAGVEQLAVGGWRSPMVAVSEAIRHYARPNDKLVVWGWATSLHVDTGLLLGTRCIPLYFPVVPGPQQPYFLDVYRRDMLRNRPAVVVDAVGLHPGRAYDRYPIRRYPAIQAILDTQYRLVATVQGAKIYALK